MRRFFLLLLELFYYREMGDGRMEIAIWMLRALHCVVYMNMAGGQFTHEDFLLHMMCFQCDGIIIQFAGLSPP